MLSTEIVFIVTLCLTVASGLGAMALVVLGDTRRNAGQRAVAVRLAQIAVIGASAIVAMLHGNI
jgi:hypothetical protein